MYDYKLSTSEVYAWQCFGTITCDPLVDEHGRECERLNDEARTEFYVELVAEDIGNLVAWHVAEAMSRA